MLRGLRVDSSSQKWSKHMHPMQIPLGYIILTAMFAAPSLFGLFTAVWMRKKAAIAVMLGMCVLASIFVVDVLTKGVAMDTARALIFVGVGVVLMIPLAFKRLGAIRRSSRKSGPVRRHVPPDGSREPSS